MVWDQYGIVSVTHRVLGSLRRPKSVRPGENGANNVQNGERLKTPNGTPPTDVPKVIFTVDDEQSWTSIDLESGYDDRTPNGVDSAHDADHHLTT